jgi:cardiolipin synthase
MRSFELNDEASLNVYDLKFAQSMTEVFETTSNPRVLMTFNAGSGGRGWKKWLR